MRAERAHTFLATPSRMQNHRSKERRAAQRRLYSRLSTLKRRTSCGRGTPCVDTFSEAIASIMLRETPDDRRVAAPGLHLTHGRGRVTIVVVWKRFLFMHLTYLLLHAKKEEVFDGSCPGDRGSSRAPLSTDASGFSGSKVHIAPCGGAHVSIL